MAQLPIFPVANNQGFVQMQTQWKSQLDPILAIPMLSGHQLSSITLAAGNNSINHLLGRMQQGWILTDINVGVAIYRNQPFNTTTLTLNSGGICIINLWVF